jgi:hypothetical protein
MKTKNPQAFPDPMRGAEQTIYNQPTHHLSQGMTLRDYFAAKAMQGLMTRAWDHIEDDKEVIKIWAKTSYLIADEMLEARKIEDQ